MRTAWVFFAIAGAMAHVGLALAQGYPSGSSVQATGVSPVGYSSAVNTPTGQVLPEGTLTMSLANNNPELAKRIHGVGGFGSLNLGVGLLPGLEAFGRLAFEGDLQCNMYLGSGCSAPMRDLSVSAKYQLPLNLPLNTKLAAGLTDYGGAATNFRSAYAVATSEQGPFDVSIGYGKGQSDRALLQGVFSSAVVRLTEHLQAQLERNAGNTRLGASYQLPLGDGADLVLAASRFVGANPVQAGLPLSSSQLSLALRLHLDRGTQQALKKPAPALEPMRLAASQNPPTVSAVSSTLSSSPSSQVASDLTSQAVPGIRAQNEALAAELKRALISEGFTRVGVSLERQETRGVAVHAYRVWAEPSAHRQSSLQALGRAVRVWLQSVAAAKGQHMAERKGFNKLSHETHKNASFNSSDFEDLPSELTVALTYLGRPVLAAKTTEQCAKLFRGGHDVCGQDRALQLLKPSDLPRDFLQAVQAQSRAADVARPQIELGLGLKTAVGTEYGLADYAAALEVGAEWSLANLAPGLGGQLVWSAPASSSGDFKFGGIYHASGFKGPRVEQAMISYWMPIPASVLSHFSLFNKPQNANRQAHSIVSDNASLDGALVLSAGNVMHAQTGGQADLYLGLDRWRLQSTWGRYSTTDFLKARSPALSAIRYSVEPAKWQLEFAAGRFYNLDRGWRISSTHWFGQTSFSAFVRQSGIEGVVMPKLRFAGFEMSFPLGSSSASEVAGLSVRGQDRWSVGLETKVGQSDNYITRGYGLMYGPRHGLADITDFDRSSLSDLWAARSTLRLAMQ